MHRRVSGLVLVLALVSVAARRDADQDALPKRLKNLAKRWLDKAPTHKKSEESNSEKENKKLKEEIRKLKAGMKKEKQVEFKFKWCGAFNESHADAAPHSDGQVNTQALKSCLTQVNVRRKQKKTYRGNRSCTSCKPGFMFVMMWHKSRAGMCAWPKLNAQTYTTELDRDAGGASPTDNNIVNTKLLRKYHHLFIWRIKDQKIKKHFWPATGAKGTPSQGSAVAICHFRKESVCRERKDGSGKMKCLVRKNVQCIAVCKHAGVLRLSNGMTLPKIAACQNSFCKGHYGIIACKGVAETE